jgi:hypothetical protein
MSVKISYNGRFSVGGKATNDMYIGIDYKIVGSNSDSMANLGIGTLVIISDMRHITICQITGIASEVESNVWSERGGRRWRYTYKMEPLTLVVKLTNLLKVFVDELTRGRSDLFWSNEYHHMISNHRQIVRRLVNEINSE